MREKFPKELLPTLIRDYVEMCSEHTEAPEEYHTACGLFMASYLVGSWAKVGSTKLNNYYLLIGESGVAKKSTAIKVALDVCIRALNYRPDIIKIEHPTKLLAPDQQQKIKTPYDLITHFSIEGLQTLGIDSGKSTGLKIGEYKTIFEINCRKGQSNTIPELTEMYDGSAIKTALLGRQAKAENYSLSIIGSSTAPWLLDFTKGHNIAGGFTNRHACFLGAPTKIIPFPKDIPEERLNLIANRFSQLIPSDLKCTSSSTGDARWSATVADLSLDVECDLVWRNYYTKRTIELRTRKATPIADLCARELTHATKFAGLAACCENKKTIERKHLEFGIRLARWCIRNLADLSFTDRNSRPESSENQRVLNLLNKNGPMNKQAIARALGGKQEAINRAIQHMLIDARLNQSNEGIIEIGEPTSNSQIHEIEIFLSNTNISEEFEKVGLENGEISHTEYLEESNV